MADTAEADTPLPKTIGGYSIISHLGRGGMVDAYRATNVNETVALRVLRSDGKVPRALDHHHQEVAILQTPALTHVRYIARYIAHGVDPEHGPWIATEFVDGMTLEDLLSKGRIPADEAIEIVMALCDAIEELAMADIVHRDLKPGNIMLVRVEAERRWTVKLVDFNISVRANTTPREAEDRIAGTPAYMSPEQCRGETMTTMSDMFSLGCILFRILTNRLPMAGDKGNAMKTISLRATAQEAPQRPQDISEDLWNALEGVLHPHPHRRLNPGSFKLLLNMARWRAKAPEEATLSVSEVITIQPPHAPPSAPTTTPPHQATSKLALGMGLGAALIMILMGAVMGVAVFTSIAMNTRSRERTQREEGVKVTPPEEDGGTRPADASIVSRRPRTPRPVARRPAPARAPDRRATPIAGTSTLASGNYEIPHPDDWADIPPTRRHAMCARFRARGVQGTVFHQFCDNW